MKPALVRREIYAAALEITLSGNMSSVQCGSAVPGQKGPETLSFKQWCSVIADLKKLKAKHIALAGGEPFLNPRWRELVAQIKDESTAVTISSNGYAITGEDVLFMKNAGVAHLAVNLDGDEETHGMIRRCPDSYPQIMDLFQLCQKHAFSIMPVTSVNKINFDAMEALLGVLLETGVKAWRIQVGHSYGRAGKELDSMLLTPPQYTKLCDSVRRWQNRHAEAIRILPADSLRYCQPSIDAMPGDYEWQGCSAGLHTVGIQCDGTVLGCLSLNDKSFAAGNVKEKSLIGIWGDDSAFSSTRSPDLSNFSGSCARCASAPVCKAGCLGMAFSLTGGISGTPYCYKAIMEANREAI